MKIVKCSKCKKYIHKTTKCFYCGNTLDFDEIELPIIHENVVTEYASIESLIESKKFIEAFNLSHVVIEWMPNFANIFWLRLLAKNKCTCTIELIQKGFNCEDDADFCNALLFSNRIEHNIYLDVKNLVLKMKKALKLEILNHEYQCKIKTDILQIKKSMNNEVDKRKSKLFSLWSDLEETEQSMYALEKDFELLSKEHIDILSKAAHEASSLKTETYRLEECTAEKLHEYKVKIKYILQRSEQAKEAMENIKKQHPWLKSFNQLVKKRDEQVQTISNEISSLRKYETYIQKKLDEIKQIEDRHRLAIHSVESYNFLDAFNILGKECYNNVLNSIGIKTDIQISIFSLDKQDSSNHINSSNNNNEDWEEDDYYNIWGLTKDNY